MPNAIVEGLFLLAFWAPPLAVAASALALLITSPAPRQAGARVHTTALTH
jgi:hypothetical protein